MAQRDYTNANTKRNALDKNAYSDIDIFFTKHPVTNYIVIKKDSDAVKRSLKNIMLTNHYERPFKPNFGANVRNLLFSLNDREIGSRSRELIMNTISALEPRVKNLAIKVKQKDNDLDVTLFYSIVNGLRQQQINFTVSRVR